MNFGAIVVLVVCIVGQSDRPIEPWADPSPPIRDGLFAWYDASRLPEAAAATGTDAPVDGRPIGVWHDGSGNRRHLVQRHQAGRPSWITRSGRAVLRFDGVDDCLERTGLDAHTSAWTLVMVVAPRTNAGGFRGLLALNPTGKRDYTDGLNVDLGPSGGGSFDTLNVEGRGFQGFRDLMTSRHALGGFHVVQVIVDPRSKRVSLAVDGAAEDRREFDAAEVAIDELTVGARFLSNDAEPDYVQGFFHGDIAELIAFDRALDEREQADLYRSLQAKHEGLDEAIGPPDSGVHSALRPPAEPIAVQTFAPGFAARRLPVDLPNVNNVKYRRDGVLVALGYNGDIHLLDDTDGDGLEDRARLFWKNEGHFRGPIGMALTPPGFRLGQGVFVPSKGKLSLVVDDDGDDRGDREVIVADGWQEIPQAVDTLGVAVDAQGAVYFGLGTGDFTNGHQVDERGEARYETSRERGAIIRIEPDGRSRSVVASGIRFPVGLAFNAAGDLFCTDQEGATWLPNGNPFDELLFIQERRHYGFPPRHSKHLPDVVDEPSVFDYAPQHQSTCGLAFDEPCNGGPVFGPARWRGDAIVTGYSRGKLYRTELLKVRGEYLARNHLFACLDQLVIDACVAPDGSLAVATHSGGPDWGSGPDGPGTLYKIRQVAVDAPQPLFAWSAGPREVRVAFDRPIDPASLTGGLAKTAIERGESVGAGDRFETLRPGYAVVAAQQAQPRHPVGVHALNLLPDGRTIVLGTDDATVATPYAVTLPDPSPIETSIEGTLPRQPALDLALGLGGVSATWEAADGTAGWSGWLPHVELAAARHFTRESAEHEALWGNLDRAGTLTLRTQLDLWSMLRPRVQLGATVDDRLPAERVILELVGPPGMEVESPLARLAFEERDGTRIARLAATPIRDEWLPIEIRLPTGPAPALFAIIRTEEDERPRLLALHRMLVPWARPASANAEPRRPPPELAGGDAGRGRLVFASEKALCSRCHLVRGEGGRIGPDLSNLVERDYDSVVRDVRRPSFALNPDYIRYTVALRDGRVLDGTLRTDGDRLIVGDAEGRETVVDRAEVEEMKSSPLSVMPEGIAERLTPDELRDLLTFLLEPSPAAADE